MYPTTILLIVWGSDDTKADNISFDTANNNFIFITICYLFLYYLGLLCKKVIFHVFVRKSPVNQ